MTSSCRMGRGRDHSLGYAPHTMVYRVSGMHTGCFPGLRGRKGPLLEVPLSQAAGSGYTPDSKTCGPLLTMKLRKGVRGLPLLTNSTPR